jgi:hypothetical protein
VDLCPSWVAKRRHNRAGRPTRRLSHLDMPGEDHVATGTCGMASEVIDTCFHIGVEKICGTEALTNWCLPPLANGSPTASQDRATPSGRNTDTSHGATATKQSTSSPR